MILCLQTLFLILFSLCDSGFAIGLSCRNEKDAPIDWFANYKLPKLENHKKGSLLAEGSAYAYLFSSMKKWVMSSNGVKSEDSMLANTLANFYDNKQGLTYLIYNDNPPGNDSGSSVGHTKGIVVFDEDSGFWIIHSIPQFPSLNGYEYPSNGLENGQSILCITFDIGTLNEIGKQLLYNSPLIYAKSLSSSITDKLDDDVKTLFTDKPSFIKKAPFTRVADIKSRGGMKIRSFAKDNQYNKDLYSDLIAPELKTSLFVETWRRGSGTKLDPACGLNYQVLDVQAINMTVSFKRKPMFIGFPSTEDHSKWAIAEGSNSKWVCIGDINRMESQFKRGGGAACFSCTSVWRAFNSTIKELDSCSN